ncbi:MAG: hypothetical protein P4M04_04075 [Acidobacteriota bacterium]|nr:hypothetical protein [Acidobacteriota bacterium]
MDTTNRPGKAVNLHVPRRSGLSYVVGYREAVSGVTECGDRKPDVATWSCLEKKHGETDFSAESEVHRMAADL